MNKIKKLNATKQFLIVFFTLFVIAPLVVMLFQIKNVDIFAIITTKQFKTGFINSVLLALSATICSVTLAYTMSLAILRTKIKHKNVISAIFTLPMLIPSISHGMGLIILLGSNGILTNFFNLSSNIYGFVGVLLGSILYSFPVAFLMISDIFKYEDYAPYEAAEVFGVPKINQFISITVPYLRKPMISVLFAVFTLVITDYGVPLMVGGNFQTLPVLMYQEVIGLLDFGKGSVIGLILLMPALIAFVVDLLNKDKASTSYVNSVRKIRPNKFRDIISKSLCLVICSVILLPIVSFCVISVVKKYPTNLSFSIDNILKSFEMNAGRFLVNSIVIALFVSIIGTAFSYITAYISSRTSGKISKILHLFSITSMAVPGIVLGLSYALVFKGSFIYGTIFILILVNIIHFFSSPYIMAYNSFNKLNPNLEDVGSTLGINRLHILLDVIIPQTKDTILEMISYFFVNCMMTISAVSFLYTTSTMPLSLMITQFEAQMLLESSAFISIIILFINLLVKFGVSIIKSKYREF